MSGKGDGKGDGAPGDETPTKKDKPKKSQSAGKLNRTSLKGRLIFSTSNEELIGPDELSRTSGGSSSEKDLLGLAGETSVSPGEYNKSPARGGTVKYKMEVDRKTIRVGGKSPREQAELPFFGIPLPDIMARDRKVPKIVTECIHWIWQNGRTYPQLCALDFRGDFRIDELIARVEKGIQGPLYEEKDADVPLVVGVLKRFFHDLPGALFQPPVLVERLSAMLPEATVFQMGEALYADLPAGHVTLVRLLFALLYDIVSGGNASAEAVSNSFGPLLFPEFTSGAAPLMGYMLTHWRALGPYLELRGRRAASATAQSEGRDFRSLATALGLMGLSRHEAMLRALDVDLNDLRTGGPLSDEDLVGLGFAQTEVAELRSLSDSTVAKSAPPEPEPVWEGEGLDPKIGQLLAKLELTHLTEVFLNFRVDWTILDMSSAADLRDLGLEEDVIEKIIVSLGKQVAEPLSEKPISVAEDGSLRLQATHLSGASTSALDPKWIVDLREIRVQRKIGLGGYAEVWMAQWKGKTVAFKLLQEETMDDQRVVDEFRREMSVMSKLDHPNIVAFYGCVDKGRSLAMILEYAGKGDLEGMLGDHSMPIQYVQRLRWAKQVAQGLQYLHTHSPRVIHRDIKSANILVDELWCTKICDFGLAKRQTIAGTNEELHGATGTLKNVLNVRSVAVQFTTLVGTPAWTAPELIANRSYSEKVDIYSFGVFLWELMCRQIPHEGMPHFDLAYAILSKNLRPPIPEWMPQTFSQLMQSCWSAKPEFRPPMDVVLKIITTMLANPRHEEVKLPY